MNEPKATDNSPEIFWRAASIARALRVSARTVHRLASQSLWPARPRGNRIEYAPPPEVVALLGRPAPAPLREIEVSYGDLGLNAAARAKVLAREAAVIHCHQLIDGGIPLPAALMNTVQQFAAQPEPFFFSASSLRRWLESYRALGLNGLVGQQPGRVGRKPSAAALTDVQRRRGQALVIEHGSVARACRVLAADPDLPAAAREVLHEAHASKSCVPPSFRDALRVAPMVAALAQGTRAARLSSSSIHSKPDVKVADVFTADDMTPNIYVWEPWPNVNGYRIGRPQLLMVRDCGSLCWLVARVIMRASGAYTADDVAGLLGDAFDNPGLPNDGLLLEGGVWRSNSVIGHKTGLSVADRIGGLASLGLRVRWAHTPGAKWEVEQGFNVLQYIMDRWPGYCGRSERDQIPEATKKLLAQAERGLVHPSTFLSRLDEFAKHVQSCSQEHNDERQDGKTLRGASPREHWTGECPTLRTLEERDKWLYRSAMHPSLVTQQGVRVSQGSGRNRFVYYYHNIELLAPRRGQTVIVFWNDHNPEADAVLLAGTSSNPRKREPIGCAQFVKSISRFNSTQEELSEAMKLKQREMAYARSELVQIEPHLMRTRKKVRPDGVARKIGDQIADSGRRADVRQALNTPAARRAEYLSEPHPDLVASGDRNQNQNANEYTSITSQTDN